MDGFMSIFSLSHKKKTYQCLVTFLIRRQSNKQFIFNISRIGYAALIRLVKQWAGTLLRMYEEALLLQWMKRHLFQLMYFVLVAFTWTKRVDYSHFMHIYFEGQQTTAFPLVWQPLVTAVEKEAFANRRQEEGWRDAGHLMANFVECFETWQFQVV